MAASHSPTLPHFSIPTGSPVAGRISFAIRESERETWFLVWSPVIHAARRNPACLSASIVETHGRALGLALLTHWATCRDYNAFIRDSSVLWRERAFQQHFGRALFDVVQISVP